MVASAEPRMHLPDSKDRVGLLGRLMLLRGCIQEAAMFGCFVRVGRSRGDEIGLKV